MLYKVVAVIPPMLQPLERFLAIFSRQEVSGKGGKKKANKANQRQGWGQG